MTASIITNMIRSSIAMQKKRANGSIRTRKRGVRPSLLPKYETMETGSFKTSVRPFYKNPKRMRKKPSLTIRQMASKVPNRTKLKSRMVSVVSLKKGRPAKSLSEYTVYRFITVNQENGNRYRISIYSPTPNVTLDSKVIIDSPNPLFVFRYEYALAKRGNAFIYRSNGDPPAQTNPRLVPGFDHHVYRALQHLIKNTNKKGLK